MGAWLRAFQGFRNTRLYTITRPFWPILYWMPAGYFLTNQLGYIKVVSGRSMQPTLNPDSSLSRDVGLFIRYPKQLYRAPHDFERDDIVVLRSPGDPKRMLIKRVVATEGDIVRTLPPYPDLEVTVPGGHIWVEGDNHYRTDDSNLFGPVSESLIDSKLHMIIWPLDRFGRLTDPESRSSTVKLDRKSLDELRRQELRHSRVTRARPHAEKQG